MDETNTILATQKYKHKIIIIALSFVCFNIINNWCPIDYLLDL